MGFNVFLRILVQLMMVYAVNDVFDMSVLITLFVHLWLAAIQVRSCSIGVHGGRG